MTPEDFVAAVTHRLRRQGYEFARKTWRRSQPGHVRKRGRRRTPIVGGAILRTRPDVFPHSSGSGPMRSWGRCWGRSSPPQVRASWSRWWGYSAHVLRGVSGCCIGLLPFFFGLGEA